MPGDRSRSSAHEAELRIEYQDPVTRARGTAVIDSLGTIAYAGVRAAPEIAGDDLLVLARLRTLRYQLARVPMAGAQLGLAYDPQAPDFTDVLGRFLTALRPLLESTLTVGPDANVPATLLDEVLERHQLPWRMFAQQKKHGWSIERWHRYQEIVSSPLGHADDTLRTVQAAFSVADLAWAAADQLFKRQITVAVLGSGPFGLRIARRLQELGANVVAVGSSAAAIYAKGGLKREVLESGDVVSSNPGEALFITGDEFYRLPVDLMIAASNEDTITVENVGRLRCGLVIEAATHSVSTNGETVLIARDVPVVPSFAATVGPVFVTDAVLRGQVDTLEQALDHLSRNVQATAREMVRLSATLRISFREAGQRLAFLHRFGKQSLRMPSQRMKTISSDEF